MSETPIWFDLPPQIVVQAGDGAVALDVVVLTEPDVSRVTVRASAGKDVFDVPHVLRRQVAIESAIELAADRAREFYTEQARRKKMLRGW